MRTEYLCPSNFSFWALTSEALTLALVLLGKGWTPAQALICILLASTFLVGSYLIVAISCVHLKALGHLCTLNTLGIKPNNSIFLHGEKSATYNGTLKCPSQTL